MVTAWRPLLRQVVTILDLAGTQYLNRQPEKRLYASRVGIDSGEGAGRWRELKDKLLTCWVRCKF